MKTPLQKRLIRTGYHEVSDLQSSVLTTVLDEKPDGSRWAAYQNQNRDALHFGSVLFLFIDPTSELRNPPVHPPLERDRPDAGDFEFVGFYDPDKKEFIDA